MTDLWAITCNRRLASFNFHQIQVKLSVKIGQPVLMRGLWMLIGELVKITGLSKDGLRYYENLGLIHSRPRTAGSRVYREYDETTLDRLSLIALGKRMHFSLREIAGALDRVINNQTTSEERRDYMLAQIAHVDAKIADLEDVKKQLLVFAMRPEKEVVDAHLKDIGLLYE